MPWPNGTPNSSQVTTSKLASAGDQTVARVDSMCRGGQTVENGGSRWGGGGGGGGENLSLIKFKPANSSQVGGMAKRYPPLSKLKTSLELTRVWSTVWPGNASSADDLLKED